MLSRESHVFPLSVSLTGSPQTEIVDQNGNSKELVSSNVCRQRPIPYGSYTAYSTGTYLITHINTSMDECACIDFDRKKTARRSISEKHLYHATLNRFPVGLLNILTLGSGRFLQDYIICKFFLNAGYSLNVSAIETCQDIGFSDALNEFKELRASSGKSFSVEIYKNMDDYKLKNPHKKIHVAYAIDIDNMHPVHLFYAHQQLLPEGIFYISVMNTDLLLGKTHNLNEWVYSGGNNLPYFSYNKLASLPEIQQRIEAKEIDETEDGYSTHIKKYSTENKIMSDVLGAYLPAIFIGLVKRYSGTLFAPKTIPSVATGSTLPEINKK